MQKWEHSFLVRYITEKRYKEAVFIGSDGMEKKCPAEEEGLLIELNKLGAEGWEVVGYGVSPSHKAIWTLKRPL
jgi:hypothetical protein